MQLGQKAHLKGYLLYNSKHMTSQKRLNYGAGKKISGCRGLRIGDEQVEHRGVLGQRNYSVWSCSDGCMSSYTGADPQSAQRPE